MQATPIPLAITSGLMRPSEVGPRELKLATMPSASTAPTASTLSPSAGAEMYCQMSLPSLPAATTTTTPLPAARSAARVMGAVLPSMSA